MSTEALSVEAASAHDPSTDAVAEAQDFSAEQTIHIKPAKRNSPAFLHSPPDSNNAAKSDGSDSELSDLDEEPALPDAPAYAKTDDSDKKDMPLDPQLQPTAEEVEDEDIGEILPDHWSGAVAVFKPTMHQFKDFKRFMDKVNSYGMKSGIIKIIPPQEWKDKQPPLDDMVKHVRVREPIKQDIMGSNGTYRQVNMLHGRSYNVPQWRSLCDQSEHQPPARRGERRANAERPKPRRPAAPKPADPSTPKKRGRKAKRGRGRPSKKDEDERPMTPLSPKPEDADKDDVVDSVEKDAEQHIDHDEAPAGPSRMGVRPQKAKPQSVSARRKFSRREGSAMIDETAFKDFDYRMDYSDFTPERCEELERAYWKTLTYASPLYGADMMGTLFDDRTESWNLNKLPNLLDVLGTKIPGVNTAYLYFGMWKATFAWHLEDVDLYSINYVHFGAPKQWYSISQADARRFEGAMKNIWPVDAKACSQFLRHKGFLISPQHLLQHYNIKVNKVVSYPGEFVVTFPYGYHSGYNLGYNCAEAVNFALEPWLEMGKIAKRCECAQAQDSVWINVHEIERKLRGEETEYEETDEEEEDEEDEEDDEAVSGLPSPPSSHGVKIKISNKKRKREPNDKSVKTKVKRIKLRLKTKAEPPCCLCPNDISVMELLPTDDGRKAHRICAMYLPETYIDIVRGKEVVSNVAGIHKDRVDLKCLYCRSKRGACFQCSQKKCARAYHATCAAAAGVFVEEEEVPVFDDDKIEYKEQAFEFSCRFHRTKRDKKADGESLEDDKRIMSEAVKLHKGDVCQLQYYRADIFAGVIVENRVDEQTFLVDVLPSGDRIEVEWKWLLLPDPADYNLPKASANAIPMPRSRKAKEKVNAKRSEDEKPRKDDPFTDGCTWAEFNLHEVEHNKEQVKVDLSKDSQLWLYLPKISTDLRPKYTEDPAVTTHNPKSNFMDTVPRLPKKVKPSTAKKQPHQLPGSSYMYSYSGGNVPSVQSGRIEKPYIYKPRTPAPGSAPQPFTAQMFAPTAAASLALNTTQHQLGHSQANGMNGALPQNPAVYSTQHFEVKRPEKQTEYSSPYPSGQPMQTTWKTSSKPTPPQSHYSQTSTAQPQASKNTQATSHAHQTSKVSWQVHPSIYQKYPFYQVNHNRESSKYRTPYSPWGGFTNGYEGDMRAHLLANPQDLMKGSSVPSGPPSNITSQQSQQSSPHQASHLQPSRPQASPPSSTQQVPAAAKSKSQISPSQGSQGLGQGAKQVTPVPVPRQYKAPPKESPVPLPANFLAVSKKPSPTGAPTGPSLSPATALVQPSPTPISTFQPATQVSRPSTADKNQTPNSQSPNGSPSRSSKLSTTPIPVPRFPAMTPHQAAAKAVASQRIAAGAQVRPTPSLPVSTSSRDGDMLMSDAPPSGIVLSTMPQEFPDVPGSESMEFMERMMANLRRVSYSGA